MQLLEQIATNTYVPMTEEQALLETALLETMFSKKELQDPNTIKKILNQKNTFTDIFKFTAIIIWAIGVAITMLPTLGLSLIPLSGLMVCVMIVLDAYPKKRNNKQLKQLKSQCEKLKNKSIKMVEKDSKNKSQYQEIIKNCDSVIKKIDEYFNVLISNEELEYIEYAKRLYSDLIKWLDKPYRLEYYELIIFTIAKELGMKENDIGKILKHKGELYKLDSKKCYDLYGYEPGETAYKIIPKLKTGETVCEVALNDDTVILYSVDSGKFIEIFFTDKDENSNIKIISLYDIATNYSDDMPDKKSIIEADKLLGYYKLSKCPQQVKPKQFPI